MVVANSYCAHERMIAHNNHLSTMPRIKFEFEDYSPKLNLYFPRKYVNINRDSKNSKKKPRNKPCYSVNRSMCGLD